MRKPEKPHGPVCVDLCDMHLLVDRTWPRTAAGYLRGKDSASSAKARGLPPARMELLHRVIMAPPDGTMVDHINHDILDNRRCNLRVTDPSGNSRNSRQPTGVSGFRGVHTRQRGGRALFEVQISVNDKSVHVGTFTSADEAARAYDKAAVQYHGSFARPNFPTAATT